MKYLVPSSDLRNDACDELHLKFPWAAQAYHQFSSIMEDKERVFPCLFARTAHKNGTLFFLFADLPDDSHELKRVCDGLAEYLTLTHKLEGLLASMNALVILFAPQEPTLCLESYNHQAWRVVQYWIDHDPQPWPATIPQDPDDPLWTLCFCGVPIFVNVSCPAHVLRPSRKVGPCLALVTQPRAGFDLVAGSNPKGNAIRKKIREQMSAFDGQPAPSYLGTYTSNENREWWQYVLMEDNRPRTDKCPLRIKAPESRSRQEYEGRRLVP